MCRRRSVAASRSSYATCCRSRWCRTRNVQRRLWVTGAQDRISGVVGDRLAIADDDDASSLGMGCRRLLNAGRLVDGCAAGNDHQTFADFRILHGQSWLRTVLSYKKCTDSHFRSQHVASGIRLEAQRFGFAGAESSITAIAQQVRYSSGAARSERRRRRRIDHRVPQAYRTKRGSRIATRVGIAESILGLRMVCE